MSLYLDARIAADGAMPCTLRMTGRDKVDRPRLCLSLMAPGEIRSGGRVIWGSGGFVELELTRTLSADQPLGFTLCYADGFRAVNRAWLPMGVYLKSSDGKTRDIEVTVPRGVASHAGRASSPPRDLGLVPPPVTWEPGGGTCRMTAIAVSEDAHFAPSAREACALARRLGQPPLLQQDGIRCDILADPSVDREGYRLDLGATEIRIAAADTAGVFYALISLIQLRRLYRGALPCGRIVDTPRFGWRGQHLDCARHFYRVGTIERLLDIMALFKLNRFHWHFADDEGFRLEVTCAPDIWQETAFRGEGQTVPGQFGGGAGPVGGSYSLADAAHLVAQARALNIEILPEIEFPAHALCLTAIRPELRDPADTGEERSVQGYGGNVMNPALPAAWDFILPLADEVARHFPFGHLHVGGDELPPGTWAGSPAMKAHARDRGLVTTEDMQGEAMERLAAHLSAQGIRACAWEEAACGSSGGIGNGALIFSWTGQGPGLAAARAGHDVVMCPAQHTYLDMAATGDTKDWGAAWAAFVSLEDTVNWDPVPDDEPELADRIAGVQGCFWSEFTTADNEMEPMIAPRILGVATRAWSPRGRCHGAEIRELANHASALFLDAGWACAG